MKSPNWFTQNRLLSHLRIATAGALIAAAVVSAIASFQPDPPNTRLTNDNVANGYISAYTIATGQPYTDAVLDECSIARGRQNEPAVVVDPGERRVDIVYAARLADGVDPDDAMPVSPEIVECRWFPAGDRPDLQRETAQALAALDRRARA